MPYDRHDQLANPDDGIDSSTRLPPNPPQSHTHVQQVAGGIPVDLPRPDRC
jgi:hypothetical protein